MSDERPVKILFVEVWVGDINNPDDHLYLCKILMALSWGIYGPRRIYLNKDQFQDYWDSQPPISRFQDEKTFVPLVLWGERGRWLGSDKVPRNMAAIHLHEKLLRTEERLK